MNLTSYIIPLIYGASCSFTFNLITSSITLPLHLLHSLKSTTMKTKTYWDSVSVLLTAARYMLTNLDNKDATGGEINPDDADKFSDCDSLEHGNSITDAPGDSGKLLAPVVAFVNSIRCCNDENVLCFWNFTANIKLLPMQHTRCTYKPWCIQTWSAKRLPSCTPRRSS